MARTFNRAYDQANRMLNTSGLSSIVYQKNGGPVIRRFMGGDYPVSREMTKEEFAGETVSPFSSNLAASDTFNMSDWAWENEQRADMLGSGLETLKDQGEDPGESSQNLRRRVEQNLRLEGPPPALERLPWNKWIPEEQKYWKEKYGPKFGIPQEDKDPTFAVAPMRDFRSNMPIINPNLINPKIDYSMGKSLFEQLKDSQLFDNDSQIRDFIYELNKYGASAATGGRVRPGGLSSIAYRNDGGGLSGWDMGSWAKDQMVADKGGLRGGDVITTEYFQPELPDTSRDTGSTETNRPLTVADRLNRGDKLSTFNAEEQEKLKDFIYPKYGIYGEHQPIPGVLNRGFKGMDKGVPFEEFTGQPYIEPKTVLGKNIIFESMYDLMYGKYNITKKQQEQKVKNDIMNKILGWPSYGSKDWEKKGFPALQKEAKKLNPKVPDVIGSTIDPNMVRKTWNREAVNVEKQADKIFDDWMYRHEVDKLDREYLATGGKVMPGGLSGIKKSININGQPHSLAWINPGEASALKAMGGSGKKVEGVPAYYYGAFGEDVDDPTVTYGMTEEGYGPFADSDVDESVETETGEGLWKGGEELASLYKGIDETYREAGVKPVPEFDDWQSMLRYNPNPPEDFLEKGIPDKLTPYWNALKDRGMSNQAVADYLAGMEPEQLASMEGAYDTGYSFGGPMGTMGGLTRDMAVSYAKKLKLKELEAEIEGLDDKLSSEERTKQIRDIFSRYDIPELGTLTARKDLKGMGSDIEDMAIKQGINPTIAKALSWAAPGSTWTDLIAGAGNALAALAGVRGEFETEGGKTFRVMRGGELVEPAMAAIPTEDSPELVTETARAVAPSPEEVEKPLTGIAKLIASSKDKKHLLPQFKNIVAAGFSEQEAADMLGVPLADMLDASSDTFIT